MSDGDGDRGARPEQDEPKQQGATGPAAPSGPRHQLAPPPAVMRRRRTVLFTIGAVVVVALGVTAWTIAPGDTATRATGPAAAAAPGTDDGTEIVDAQPVTPDQLAGLPHATTDGTVNAAPSDPAPDQTPGERLAQPLRTVPVYASPGGQAIASLPPVQIVSDTTLPVVAEQPGWLEVLLPSRPNGRAGWIRHDDNIRTLHTDFRILVDRSRFSLTLFKDDKVIGRWTVGVGKPVSPTPATRTSILASIKDNHPTFSPIVLALGAHSDVYLHYGEIAGVPGPGTIGLHTWPSATVYGQPSSDGCIRIPPDALQVISTTVPIGSPVLIR